MEDLKFPKIGDTVFYRTTDKFCGYEQGTVIEISTQSDLSGDYTKKFLLQRNLLLS